MKTQTDLQGLLAALGEGSQDIPLVTDLLTASVDTGRVIVVQLAGTHRYTQIKDSAAEDQWFSPTLCFTVTHRGFITHLSSCAMAAICSTLS